MPEAHLPAAGTSPWSRGRPLSLPGQARSSRQGCSTGGMVAAGCGEARAGATQPPRPHLHSTAGRRPPLFPSHPHLRRGTGEAIEGGRVRAGVAGSAAALRLAVFACRARRRLDGALGHAGASDGDAPVFGKEEDMHTCNKRHITRPLAPRTKVLWRVVCGVGWLGSGRSCCTRWGAWSAAFCSAIGAE